MDDLRSTLTNRDLIDGFQSDKNTAMYKEAKEGSEDYVRMRLYEDGIFRGILPMKSVDASDLDEQVDTDRPCMVLEKEPNAEAAYSVPFATLPIGAYIKGVKYRVMFDRIMSRRYRIDIDLLLTYKMDIKKLFEDILLKKIQDEEDRKSLATVNYIVTQGETNFNAVYDSAHQNANARNANIGNIVQNITYANMDRVSLKEMSKGLPYTDNALNPSVALVNNITARDICGLSRDEIGGDLAEELFIKGMSEKMIMGIKWLITTKKHLVRVGTVYQFAEPKFLGKSFALRDVTLSTKSEDMFIEFYAWESIGGAFANDAAVCCAHFGDTANHSWEDGAAL